MYIITLTWRQMRRRLGFLSLLAVLVALTAWAGRSAMLAAVFGAETKPLTRADSPDDRVALTFDVTWGTEELSRILATLDAHGVKGTFFVGGTFLDLHGERVKQLAAGGHEIGTLGQKIVDLSSLTEQEVTTNLLASQSALSKVLGGPVRYFRPPQGPATPTVVAAARAANLITVTHSLDSLDHLNQPAARIASRVVNQARRGDIILLSASDWSRETNRALPEIIRGLKARGFKLVRLSELVPAE
jgi:peptidoglycan/xylan/chitin deacetylase (PgdA/CDA1 family)